MRRLLGTAQTCPCRSLKITVAFVVGQYGLYLSGINVIWNGMGSVVHVGPSETVIVNRRNAVLVFG